MKMKRLAVTACAWAMFSAAASAQADSSYLGIGLGTTKLRDSELSDYTGSLDITYDNGHALMLAIGQSIDSARVEFELGYRKNHLKAIGFPGAMFNAGGNVTAKSAMGNLFLDLGDQDALRPYIGFGAGLAKVEVNDATVMGIWLGNDDDTVFAWQFMAGFSYPVSDKTLLDLSYRYFGTSDPDFSGIKSEYRTHNFAVGLRFSL